MRRISLFVVSLVMAGGFALASANAQDSVFRYAADPDASEAADTASTESGEEESYNSYEAWPTSGKSLVQRKAMFRAQQREMRIASRKWHGYTASRPPVFGNPYYMDAYSPSLWSNSVYGTQNFYGPFGWYFPRQSLSSYRWTPMAAYATVYR